MKNFLDGGEAMVAALRALDVDYIFSSPGSDWGALWEAMARQKVNNAPGPKYVSCGHETLAVNLAIGNTYLTGRMQAVVLHTGVGLLQGSIGIDAANKLNLPMLVFSSEAQTYGEKPGFDPGQQWIATLNNVGGPQRLVEPIVKWASSAPSVDNLFEMIVRAGELAQQTPAGPVYINVPIETTLQEWVPPQRLRKAIKVKPPQAPVSEIERVAKLLAAAECPVIVTEGVGRSVEGYKNLVELAELLAIPVVESWPAEVSNFPKDHPLHHGFTLQPFQDIADVVLVVRSRVPWYPGRNRPAKATVVLIDEIPVHPNMVYQNIGPDIVLEGDVVHSLKELSNAVRAAKPDAGKVKQRRQRAEAGHEKMVAQFREAEGQPQGKNGLSAKWVCRTLSETLPEDTIYVDETITYRSATLPYLKLRRPQTSYRIGGGLGQGFGTALGVKVGAPDKIVSLVVGDGAFLYNPLTQCLALSKHENLPILAVVLNNSGYDSMAKEHRAWYPDGIAAANNIFYGRTITDFDYAQLAAPFGAYGRKVEKAEELKPALEEAVKAVKSGRTAILNIICDPVPNAR
ncbi:MAG TPA: thiamine pyrophosphate-dependent enzyme [Alphaproteobacteria bacterium]